MSNVLHKITKQYLKSVNTPDYMDGNWLINPILPDCEASEWVVDGEIVRESTLEEIQVKIDLELAEEQSKIDDKLLDKAEKDADIIKAREDFIALSIDEKIMFLYEGKI